MSARRLSRRLSPGARYAICAAGLGLFILFASLGIWQIQRLFWKVDLIERVETRVALEPISLENLLVLPEPEREYRPVRVSGRFLHDKEALVQAVTELGGGHWVLTPMETETGAVVLVNRGYVPPEFRDPATRPADEVAEIVGLARLNEPGGAFLRENDPAADRWYSRDIAAIGAARGVTGLADIFIDARAGTDMPVGGLTVIHFRNTHLIYALTWFVLAGLVAWALILFFRFEHSLQRDRS